MLKQIIIIKYSIRRVGDVNELTVLKSFELEPYSLGCNEIFLRKHSETELDSELDRVGFRIWSSVLYPFISILNSNIHRETSHLLNQCFLLLATV